jgi:hypothetical protein
VIDTELVTKAVTASSPVAFEPRFSVEPRDRNNRARVATSDICGLKAAFLAGYPSEVLQVIGSATSSNDVDWP